ncbi:phosphotransferase [Actinoplanes sp. NPDC026619]|uniref:phosphotransferase n=1 Tax=Actinoplanes sp. NPDC026619 TaxID=3155798 RepID=UPI0033C3F509
MTETANTRIGWLDLPAAVRSRIEGIIGGGAVTEAVSQRGGFSPGTADRVRTERGARAFVKAVSPALNSRSAELARMEIHVSESLPRTAPVPELLGAFDDGDWVVLVMEDVDGAPPRTPWVAVEFDAALAALTELAAALTPSPVPGLPTTAERLGDDFTAWERIAVDPPADLDPWLAGKLPELRAAAKRSLEILGTGDTLTHCDIRADNMLVRSDDGAVMIVDWPWGCVGPGWVDRLLLGADAYVHGGDPAPALHGIDPAVVTDFLAGMSGLFEFVHRLPPPPAIPAVRDFQRRQAEALRPWLRERL